MKDNPVKIVELFVLRFIRGGTIFGDWIYWHILFFLYFSSWMSLLYENIKNRAI